MKNVHFENKSISRHFFWFIWFIYVVVYMTKNCFSAAMSAIVFEGAMTKSQTGLITAVFYLVYAPLQVVGGIFADKYDPEKLIKIGLMGSGLANLMVYLNQNYYVVLITWIFNAIVQFAIWPSVFKIVSSQLVQGDRKNSAYYISFSATVGMLLAYLVAALLTKWQYNFLISSLSLFALAVALHIVTKRVGPYMIEDEVSANQTKTETAAEKIGTIKLLVESGFLILIVAAFIRTVVANSIKTLSSTMLMESYEIVSPSLGNLLNMFIIGVGVVATVIVKQYLYPKYIKSAPNGIVSMFIIALITLSLLLLGNINISLTVVLLCVVSGSLTATTLLMQYCNLRFAKFGKSGTAAGVMNAATSLGVVVNSYGITKIAEVYDWTVVKIVFLGLIAVALLLMLVMIPFWKRFKKKYHPHVLQPLVEN